jgi:SAM-dependent methyltransferase
MENPVVQFQLMLKAISGMPYAAREKACDSIQFLLEDYIKIFPPVSIKTYTSLFSAMREFAGLFIQDKDVLELGPGFSLGLVFLAALSGARKAWAADLFPHNMGPDHDYIVSMYEHVAKNPRFLITMDQPWDVDRVTNEFAKLIDRDQQGRYSFRKSKIEYLFPFTGEKLPFDNEAIDVSLSCAAFEHFREPAAVVRELSRITRPAGVSCHIIDFRDHRDFTRPFEFLTMTENAWQQFHSASQSYTYTNRLRHSQVVSLFNDAGFRLLGVQPSITGLLDKEVQARLVAPYTDIPVGELETLVQIYVFRKDHAPT